VPITTPRPEIFLRPTPLSDLRDHAPVQAKARTMPADHRFGSDHQEQLFPIGPEPAGQDPEELIENGQCGPRVSTLEYTESLTKCEVLHQQSCRDRKSLRIAPNQRRRKRNIGTVIANWRVRKLCKLLISWPDGVLARHRRLPSLRAPVD